MTSQKRDLIKLKFLWQFSQKITLNCNGPTEEIRLLVFQNVYQGQWVTIFSKISVMKSKYCLDFSVS